MNLIEFKNKLNKGSLLGGEVVYIKEDNLLYGIKSINKNDEDKQITILKSSEESIKTDDFLKILNDICLYEDLVEVVIGEGEYIRGVNKDIKSIEFAQFELIKMIFINV